MGRILETDLPREHYDVFEVTQITRGTPLESAVAADLVSIAPGRASEVHRHNEAETVLLILDGAGIVLVGESSLPRIEGGPRPHRQGGLPRRPHRGGIADLPLRPVAADPRQGAGDPGPGASEVGSMIPGSVPPTA